MSAENEKQLFISDLDADNTEEEIMQFFHSQMKDDSLKSVKVVRDHNPPNLSRRYGYLTFATREDADKALESLNYRKIGRATQQYRLQPYERDSTRRKSQFANIILKNLPADITPQELHDFCQTHGNIFSLKVAEKRSDSAKNTHGFVRFHTEDEANKAIEGLNKKSFHDNVITVEHAVPFTTAKHDEIFIHGYPKEVTEEQLKESLSTFGEVKQLDRRDPNEKYPNGYAYVWFVDEAAAKKCVDELNGKESLPSTTSKPEEKKSSQTEVESEEAKPTEVPLSVTIYHPRWERVQYKRHLLEITRRRNLYVRGFPVQNFDTADLKKIFEKFGEITSCIVMKGADGISRGYGFCCFGTDKAAREAYTELADKDINIPKADGEEGNNQTIRLYVNYIIPKSELQASRQRAPQDHRPMHRERHPRGGPKPQSQFPMYPFFPLMPSSPGSQMPTPGSMNSPSSPPYPYARPYPQANVSSPPPNVMQAQQHYQFPQQQRFPPNRRQQPYPMYARMPFFPQYPMQMYMNYLRGGAMMPYGPQVHNATGSPLPGISTNSPSSTAPSTASPSSTGYPGGQVGSPSQGAQTSSPRSAGQPGTPTSTSMPSSPESGTSSMGGSPSTQPHIEPVFVNQQQLLSLPPDEQKNQLGEMLFPKISTLDNTNAGKITGMLLELEVQELVRLLEEPRELRSKVVEAQQVLQEAQQSVGDVQASQ